MIREYSIITSVEMYDEREIRDLSYNYRSKMLILLSGFL